MARYVKVSSVSVKDGVNYSGDPSRDLKLETDRMIDSWNRLLSRVLPEKPDLIVLPEACDRYHNYPLSRRLEYYEVRGDRLLRFFKEKAYENSCYIAYSAVRKLEDGTYRNTTQLIDRKGEIAGLYNKNHPTIGETEDGKILPGKDARVIPCDFGKVACAICFDLNFDPLWEKYKPQKPDIVLFSSAYHGGLMQNYRAYQLRSYFIGSIMNLENQETRTTVNIMDLKTGKETEITEPGPLIPPQKIDEFFETAKKAVEEASVVVLSGSLPKGVDPDIYKTLILFAKDLGKYTVLDASGQPLEKGIEAGPTAIKPNVREMGALMGNEKPGKEQMAEYCGRLREKGISYVCVSMGSEGAFLSFEDQIHFMKAFSVNAVNTIGCGDAMTAGLAVGLQRGYKPFDMLRFATACAASNATFEEIGVVDKETVEKLYLRP
jgi:1-phosphofructokinase family hexose kinase